MTKTDENQTTETAAPPAVRPPRKKRSALRLPLMLSLPVALVLAGGWYWMNGARWISTENAYVQQNKVLIASEVAGRIAEVFVGQNQSVDPGVPLFRIDDASYRIEVEKAVSAVAQARLKVEQLRTAYRDALLKAETARNTLAYQQGQFERQDKLRKSGNATESQYDTARHDLDLAQQSVAEADQGIADALAALGGKPDIATDAHPSVMSALAAEDSARLDLEHTVIKAPTHGTVAQVSNLQVGQYVAAGSAVLAVVDLNSTWIEANFKETDLQHMKPGQKAELVLDAYPDKPLHGHIDSFGAGTGAMFSLLPAQNATGNWVKVVQRVPVRIAIDGSTIPELKAGLSVAVDVDTGFLRHLPKGVQSILDNLGLGSIADAATLQ